MDICRLFSQFKTGSQGHHFHQRPSVVPFPQITCFSLSKFHVPPINGGKLQVRAVSLQEGERNFIWNPHYSFSPFLFQRISTFVYYSARFIFIFGNNQFRVMITLSSILPFCSAGETKWQSPIEFFFTLCRALKEIGGFISQMFHLFLDCLLIFLIHSSRNLGRFLKIFSTYLFFPHCLWIW